jgi:hypothetical protein
MHMTKEIQSGLISRRSAFWLVGVALPAAILAASETKAQTPGMERREDRRDDREKRRDVRREGDPLTTTGTAPAPR